MLNLNDKTILITGASSGIVAATAKLLAQSGATLILLARRLDRLKNIAHELERDYLIKYFTLPIVRSIEKSQNDIKINNLCVFYLSFNVKTI